MARAVQSAAIDRRPLTHTAAARVVFGTQIAVVASARIIDRDLLAETGRRNAHAHVAGVIQTGAIDKRTFADAIRADIIGRAQVAIAAASAFVRRNRFALSG